MKKALSLLLLFTLFSPALAQDRRPNIILFLTDDQRWDTLSSSGHPLLKTPNIDRLATEGAQFRNAFVTTSICCISRASYITGQLCRHHRVGDFSTALPAASLEQSFPAQLKKAGYRLGCFGKWGMGGKAPKELFDAWEAWAGQGEYFHQVNGEKIHNSEYLTRRARDFIRSTPANQPYCLIILYKSPHDIHQADPRDAKLFENDTIIPHKTATDAHFNQLPEFLRLSMARTRAVRDFPTPEKYQAYVKEYLRCIASVDRSVGEVMTEVQQRGDSADTLVAYASDNGYFLGERGFIHKWLMYEESIRVPMIVRYPRKALAGHKVDAMALNIDIAPTILDFAGVPVPATMDGRTLRPILEGKPTDWRSFFFYEHHFHARNMAPEGAIPRTEGIRTSDWKYITYIDEKIPYEELYDLKNDPFEERNLATDPRWSNKLRDMKSLYESELKRLPPAVLPKEPKKK
jgi:arylsulfatase A-like enzyme